MLTETKTVYFDKKGPSNTSETLLLAQTRAKALGITDVVVASSTGKTGVEAAKIFAGCNLVVVAGAVGFREPNQVRMREENRKAIEENGGKVLFAGHAFGMLGRAVNDQFGTIQIDELVANVLRILGQGVKVGCEISCMAVDAGFIKAGGESMAIGGSGGGSDAAIVLKPANTHRFFDTRILEIVCKPRG